MYPKKDSRSQPYLEPHETRSKRDDCNKLGPIALRQALWCTCPPRLELRVDRSEPGEYICMSERLRSFQRAVVLGGL